MRRLASLSAALLLTAFLAASGLHLAECPYALGHEDECALCMVAPYSAPQETAPSRIDVAAASPLFFFRAAEPAAIPHPPSRRSLRQPRAPPVR